LAVGGGSGETGRGSFRPFFLHPFARLSRIYLLDDIRNSRSHRRPRREDCAMLGPQVDPRQSATSEPILRLRGLRVCYGSFVAVEGLDLDVRRGEVFGL